MPTRSASPAGTSLRKGISSSTAARPRATDRGLPRQRARQRQLAASQQRFLGNQIAQLPLPAQARAVRAAPAHVIEVRVAAVEAPQRPAASARPRCAGMPARHPGDAPWRDPGRRGDAPPGPAGGAWRECASRCRHACFSASRSRFARAWSSTRSRRRGGWLSPRPGNRLARLAAARWKRRGITRARGGGRRIPGAAWVPPGQGCHTDAAGPSNPAHHPLPRYWSLAARAHDGWVDASADSSARSIAVDRSRHCCVPP